MKHKKGQGISINVLIIALVALIVLIVIIAIFTGKIRGVNTGLQDCMTKGGKCEKSEDCPPGSSEVIGVSSCPNEDEKCCISVFEKKE